jgi:hypothetical protein
MAYGRLLVIALARCLPALLAVCLFSLPAFAQETWFGTYFSTSKYKWTYRLSAVGGQIVTQGLGELGNDRRNIPCDSVAFPADRQFQATCHNGNLSVTLKASLQNWTSAMSLAAADGAKATMPLWRLDPAPSSRTLIYRLESEVPCATAPISGFQFQHCRASNVFTSGTNNYQGWRLEFADAQSEAVVTYTKPLATGNVVVWPQEVLPSIWRNSDLLVGVAETMSGAGAAEFVDGAFMFRFQKGARRCKGFAVFHGTNGMLATTRLVGFLCRATNVEIANAEAKFFIDGLVLK